MIVLIIVQIVIVVILLIFMLNNWYEYIKDKRKIREYNRDKRENS